MANERLQRGASGHLLYTATGHLANECATTTACFYCENPVPKNITATISGITQCGCSSDSRFRMLLTILGSVTMAEISPCVWEFIDADAATYEYYSGSDCPTGSHTTVVGDVRYLLRKYSLTEWVMQIMSHRVISPSEFYYHIFYDRVVVASDNCDLGFAFTNEIVIGDCWTTLGWSPYAINAKAVAYGGTATI